MLASRVPRTLASATRAHAPRVVRPTVASRTFPSSPARHIVHMIKTADEFRKAVSDHDRVVVDCFATWCGPCKAIAPILHRHSEDAAFKDKVHFIKVDVDELPEVSAALGVRAMPTFFFFRRGEKVDQVVGADPTGLTAALSKMAV